MSSVDDASRWNGELCGSQSSLGRFLKSGSRVSELDFVLLCLRMSC